MSQSKCLGFGIIIGIIVTSGMRIMTFMLLIYPAWHIVSVQSVSDKQTSESTDTFSFPFAAWLLLDV